MSRRTFHLLAPLFLRPHPANRTTKYTHWYTQSISVSFRRHKLTGVFLMQIHKSDTTEYRHSELFGYTSFPHFGQLCFYRSELFCVFLFSLCLIRRFPSYLVVAFPFAGPTNCRRHARRRQPARICPRFSLSPSRPRRSQVIC